MQFMERKQMLILIDPSNYEFHRQDLDDMYRLRHKVFYEKLKWDVTSVNGMEKDEYDEKHAHYIIYKDEQGVVRGCIRLIEMTNPCMFDGPFKFMLPDLKDFKYQGYWETSRVAVDYNFDETYTIKTASHISASIFAAAMHFGLNLEKIELFLGISFPSIAKLYSTYNIIGALITDRNVNGAQLTVVGYTPLHYTYKKLLKRISYDPSKPLLYHKHSFSISAQNILSSINHVSLSSPSHNNYYDNAKNLYNY